MSYDEVEIEDMSWSEELQAYTYQCPCGDLFQITLVGSGAAPNTHAHNSTRTRQNLGGKSVKGLLGGQTLPSHGFAACRAQAALPLLPHPRSCAVLIVIPGGAALWRGDCAVPQLLPLHHSHLQPGGSAQPAAAARHTLLPSCR
jgi:hypothetical protein